MVKVNLGGCASFVKDEDYKEYVGKALEAFDVLANESGAGNDFLGWKRLPSETPEALIAECEAVRDNWKAKGVNLVVVIGIGGSYLGARCAIEALSHNFAKQLSGAKEAPEVVFAGNNLSEEYLAELMDLVAERNVATVVISKSGTTTEPALAFRIFKNLVEKKYGKEGAKSRIFCTTDAKRGTLKSLADTEGYETFVIADDIGGRFSVLTAVGLLPIAVAGCDIAAIMQGAQKAREDFAAPFAENDCYQYAAIRNILYRKGKSVELMVSYDPSFAMMNEWYKQLFGESEGKDNKGLFPASVIFSTDLHSMGQYIQEGSRLMFETVVDIKQPKQDLYLEDDAENLDGLNFLTGQNMSVVNRKALEGAILAHTEGGVPNIVLELDDTKEESFGYMVYFFEKACAVSGYMLGVNPFNQPGVESYKKNMFALLGKPGYESQKAALEAKLN